MLFNSAGEASSPSLVTRSRHYAGDPSAAPNPIWTEAEHKQSVNIAYDDLLEIARGIGVSFANKTWYFNTVSGKILYPLPAGFVSEIAVAISSNGSNLSSTSPSSANITYLDHKDSDTARRNYDTQATTSPGGYYLEGGKLAIVPPVTAAEAGELAGKLVYTGTEMLMTENEDEPVFARPHHDLIALRSAKYLLGSRNLPFPWADLLGEKERRFRVYLRRIESSKRSQIPVEGIPSMVSRWRGSGIPRFGQMSKG